MNNFENFFPGIDPKLLVKYLVTYPVPSGTKPLLEKTCYTLAEAQQWKRDLESLLFKKVEIKIV